MSKNRARPVSHGRDHSPGGADPIPGLSGGIGFDTYPQAGNWLYAETTDETGAGGSPSGLGIELNDFSSNGGIMISSFAGGHSRISLNEFGGDDIILDPADEIKLQGDTVVTGSFTANGPDADLSMNTSAQLRAGSSDHYIVRVDDTDGVTFASDNWGGIFLKVVQVGPTIEYHILSGATWVADL
jgi:hypothetical protein